MKAVQAFRPRSEPSGQHSWGCSRLNLCFPVVVTSGELYYVDGESKDPHPEDIDWVTVERDIEMESLAGIFNMDVVTYPALRHYLESRVLPFCNEVSAAVANDPWVLAPPEQTPDINLIW
ncbi:hypothetical protein AB0K49_18370 [Streptomyces decoyicus]|uniref:hypothetical protein n=1 Tax=Streptomyces decoyicus TaxID=249567 RepID=UPI00345CB27F